MSAETVVTTIAGFLAPLVTQLLKKQAGVSGRWAVIVATVVSLLMALAALGATSGIHSFRDVVDNAVLIFALATIAFKMIAPEKKENGAGRAETRP